jgi:hypothetical protein
VEEKKSLDGTRIKVEEVAQLSQKMSACHIPLTRSCEWEL